MIPQNDNDGFTDQEERAAAWCLRIAERPLTSAEQDDFDEWLAADERHAQCFEQMVAVWQCTDAIAELPGFLSLRAKALMMMENARNNDERPLRSLTRRHAFAALTAFALTAGGGAWYWAKSPDVYATAVGERRTVRLDDGSSVSLDAASRMLVSFTDERRAVTLEHGRAKFDVAKDPLRPFTVTAGSQSVVAVGTSFSVELLRNQLRVLLFEGQVAVVPRAVAANVKVRRPAPATTQLVPGQELVADLSSGTAEVLPVEAERSLGWEGGRVDFVDMPLAGAVERINRYAASPIVLGDAAAGRHIVNGVFDAGDTDSFVRGVTSLYPLSARQEGDRIIIKTVNSGADEEKNSQR